MTQYGNSLSLQSNGIMYNNNGTISLVSLINNGVLITNNSAAPSLLANAASAGMVLTSNSGAPPSWQVVPTSALSITTVNNAASPYTVLSTDQFLAVNTSGGAVSILLPNAPTTGRVIYVKDSVGLSATSNITITTVGGSVTIDGSTSYVLKTNYAAISLIFDGTSYEVF
jgi:hypothetical protein